jgi:hypothetical protein
MSMFRYHRKVEKFKIKIHKDVTAFILENLDCECEYIGETASTYFYTFSDQMDYINDSACVLDFVINEVIKEFGEYKEDPLTWYFMMMCSKLYDEVMTEYHDEVECVLEEHFIDVSGNIMEFIRLE